MFTLEREFGILGYGFWFKLLEILGNTEGHFIDAQDVATMKYLQAQTYTDEETCLKILGLLSNLDAIDSGLWSGGLIWSDNFVAGLLPLYRKRDCTTPTKPDNRHPKPQTSGKKDQITVEEGEEGDKGEEGKKKRYIVNPDGLTASLLAEIWNEKAPPECKRVSMPFKRKKADLDKIKDALKRNPDPAWWERVILLLHNLPFVRGHNKRGWKITIDVLVRDAELILDGKYEGTYGKGPEGGGRPAQPRDPKYEGLG
jgi:hypothetical protein